MKHKFGTYLGIGIVALAAWGIFKLVFNAGSVGIVQ